MGKFNLRVYEVIIPDMFVQGNMKLEREKTMT